ncbi:hypothetical protein K437DRAFT_128456 [Tilletiaria anomala UBC 951]|uniref:Uncharacterized protein n=1 Tax=Tilletiaria anomala (strain ATCC 24038 / CBS 436.72 / UBC 951) TaxID=1037660 RepID=A0A066W1G1_TILAU|nr:uncharacterized protein K437DRAFT_128456 [Tilletiaria anomala UBC 951]KDN44889.1 hypothetical protein K437DRAFT_128456 [Tilletiaria anomala UBC 951]
MYVVYVRVQVCAPFPLPPRAQGAKTRCALRVSQVESRLARFSSLMRTGSSRCCDARWTSAPPTPPALLPLSRSSSGRARAAPCPFAQRRPPKRPYPCFRAPPSVLFVQTRPALCRRRQRPRTMA